jgi:hypothetical protein
LAPDVGRINMRGWPPSGRRKCDTRGAELSRPLRERAREYRKLGRREGGRGERIGK